MRLRSRQKKELTLLVLSGEGERVHSLRFSRSRLLGLVTLWLLLLLGAAAVGFHWSGEGEKPAQGASGVVALSADARQK